LIEVLSKRGRHPTAAAPKIENIGRGRKSRLAKKLNEVPCNPQRVAAADDIRERNPAQCLGLHGLEDRLHAGIVNVTHWLFFQSLKPSGPLLRAALSANQIMDLFSLSEGDSTQAVVGGAAQKDAFAPPSGA
jgi:hypothetical protein